MCGQGKGQDANGNEWLTCWSKEDKKGSGADRGELIDVNHCLDN